MDHFDTLRITLGAMVGNVDEFCRDVLDGMVDVPTDLEAMPIITLLQDLSWGGFIINSDVSPFSFKFSVTSSERPLHQVRVQVYMSHAVHAPKPGVMHINFDELDFHKVVGNKHLQLAFEMLTSKNAFKASKALIELCAPS